MSKGDARISVVSNLVEGIRAIKLLTWESFILSDIALKRKTELRSLRQFLLLNLLNYMLLTSIPIFVAALTFWVYIAAGNELTASTAFTALSLLNMLRGPLFMFPRVLSAVLDGYVGIERAQSLLNTEECKREKFVCEVDENKVGISVVNQSFDWKRIPVINLNRTSSSSKNDKKEEDQQQRNVAAAAEEKEIEMGSSAESSSTEVTAEPDERSSAPSLVNINMTLKKSQLGIVLGSVGSGKSTLLSSLLGECPSVSTTTQHATTKMITGSVAYVSQLPFIAQTTVRENILFGQSYDSEFYETCLEVCALKDDIARFPSGDATEIGERGINLSGGQKMRVALARAMYSQAQVYLLDDPLAAVDAHVAEIIWTRGIRGLLKDKTVLLTTNSVQYCKEANQIFLMSETNDTSTTKNVGFSARVVEQGSWMEIKNDDTLLLHQMIVTEEDRKESRMNDVESISVSLNSPMPMPTKKQAEENVVASVSKQHTKKELTDGKLISKEQQEKGAIKTRAWCAYFNAVGKFTCSVILLIYITRESSRVGMELWMSEWTDVETARYVLNASTSIDNTTSSKTGLNDPVTSYYLYGYLTWAAVALFVAGIRSIIILIGAMHGAEKTFDGLIRSIAHAPMSWYDTTPSGRILNRISSDTSQIDERVPNMLRDTTDSFIRILGTLVSVLCCVK